MVGLAIGTDGLLYRDEFKGPPTFAHWDACFKVLMCALIMMNSVDPPHLIAYRDLISEYVTTFGETCWAVIYQADFRFRREYMEEIRRNQSQRLNVFIRLNHQSLFDPARPWNHCFALATDPELWPYWRKTIETPCTLILAQAHSPARYLGGDAQVAPTSDAHMATFHAGEDLQNELQATPRDGRRARPKPAPKATPKGKPNPKGSGKGDKAKPKPQNVVPKVVNGR